MNGAIDGAIYDVFRNRLAYYQDGPNGQTLLLDNHQNILGRYDPSNDTTFDGNLNIMGKGNTLGRLIPASPVMADGMTPRRAVRYDGQITIGHGMPRRAQDFGVGGADYLGRDHSHRGAGALCDVWRFYLLIFSFVVLVIAYALLRLAYIKAVSAWAVLVQHWQSVGVLHGISDTFCVLASWQVAYTHVTQHWMIASCHVVGRWVFHFGIYLCNVGR